MKTKLKKIYNIVTWIILVIMICFFIYCVYAVSVAKDKGDDGAFVFGYRPIFILSGSMEPYMETNGIALTKEVNDISEIKTGDVITYLMKNPDGSKVHITHRIVSINKDEDTIRTKGDNNNVEDNYNISMKQVEAKVICVFNQTAWVVETWQKNLISKIFLVSLPVTIILLYYLLKTLIFRKEDNEPEEDSVIQDTKRDILK